MNLFASYYDYGSSADDVIAGIVFGALLGAAIALTISYLIAKTFYDIACQKGHEEKKYFHFCFWLGVVGYIMVAALPDRKQPTANPVIITGNQTNAAQTPAPDRLPEL